MKSFQGCHFLLLQGKCNIGNIDHHDNHNAIIFSRTRLSDTGLIIESLLASLYVLFILISGTRLVQCLYKYNYGQFVTIVSNGWRQSELNQAFIYLSSSLLTATRPHLIKFELELL